TDAALGAHGAQIVLRRPAGVAGYAAADIRIVLPPKAAADPDILHPAKPIGERKRRQRRYEGAAEKERIGVLVLEALPFTVEYADRIIGDVPGQPAPQHGAGLFVLRNAERAHHYRAL